MMKNILGLFLLILGINGAIAQDSLAVKYAATITSDELREHLMYLASDDFEGRDTGSEGQKKAARYIANRFENYGFPPVNGSYFQEFPLKLSSIEASSIAVGDKTYNFPEDFLFFPGFSEGEYEFDQWVFAGYGIEDENYNDYNGIDVSNKAVIILDGEPMRKGVSVITGTEKESSWANDLRKKRDLAKEKGAAAVVIVHDQYELYLSRVRYYLEQPRMVLDRNNNASNESIPTIYITQKLAEDLMTGTKAEKLNKIKKKISRKKAPLNFNFQQRISFNAKFGRNQLTSENVLGYIEGTDKKEEVVVVTAHYDHVGRKGDDIYNGADDDGSGTVSALEIAEAFSEAVKDGNGPRRSVLIMTVSGEEKGLLGSEWYTDNPIFPLENTVADLNIDMIGRVDEAHSEDPNYVYLIGSDKLSTQLHDISEDANSSYTKLELDYTYNDPNDPNRFYYRSDHYNFAKHGIPVIFYFSGVHEDYHQPTDTPDKIMYDKMVPIVRLIFHTAWELANREGRIQVDVNQEGSVE